MSSMVHSHGSESEYEFDLSGGTLCLDFANTVSRRKVPERAADHLGDYADLVAFAEQSKMLSPKQSDELRTQARRHSSKAREALRNAISLRENLYDAFSA